MRICFCPYTTHPHDNDEPPYTERSLHVLTYPHRILALPAVVKHISLL